MGQICPSVCRFADIFIGEDFGPVVQARPLHMCLAWDASSPSGPSELVNVDHSSQIWQWPAHPQAVCRLLTARGQQTLRELMRGASLPPSLVRARA